MTWWQWFLVTYGVLTIIGALALAHVLWRELRRRSAVDRAYKLLREIRERQRRP